jgi:miniconductance mechanosensitive channel
VVFVNLTDFSFYTELQPWAQAALGLALLALLALAVRLALQQVLFHFVRAWRNALPAMGWAQIIWHDHVLLRIAKISPSLVVQLGIHWVEHLPPQATQAIGNIAAAFTIYHVVRVVAELLNEINAAHDRHDGPKATRTHSIKSYVQLGKLMATIVGVLLVVATIMDRSPLLLLSGLGAASAILMLVFKDTIMSFVAGVLLSSNDMLRVGDWIEMPQVGADGFVVDIALHTVKVQNWDKTMTTIPTWRLMSDSYKNWRGMFESGGRRIRRSLPIDAHSIHQLTDTERQRLSAMPLLQAYWDNPLFGADPSQSSNLAAFKAYAQAYLIAHPGVHKAPNMFMLVRTMEPTPMGVPLELFCYTATTVWVEYEAIQGQIFDHLISMLPQFGLCLYQRSSDYNQHYPSPP